MEITTLRKAIRMLLTGMRPADLEKKYSFTHGFTSRLVKKVRELGFTSAEELDRLTDDELEALYYGRRRMPGETDKKGRIFIRPNLPAPEAHYREARKHANTPSERKLEPTRTVLLDVYYFEDPASLALVAKGGHAFLSVSHCLKLWHDHVQTVVPKACRLTHEMGAEVEFDFTGVTIEYGEPSDGRRATFLVGVLPASGYIVLRAIESQSIGPVPDGMAACLRAFGGVPAVLCVDNFKGAVKKADRFGGEINEQFAAMAQYFGAEVFTARPNTPKDKGTAEAAVRFCSRYAPARLKHHTVKHGPMRTLREMNDFLAPLVAKMNERSIRGIGKSRRAMWEEEKQCLMQPESWDYSYSRITQVTVPPTGRIAHAKHEYALPSKWVGENVMMELTASSVTFRSGTAIIAAYARRDGEDGVSSSREDYISPDHLACDIMRIPCQKDMLIEWAGQIGPNVTMWCRDLMNGGLPWHKKVRYVLSVLKLPEARISNYVRLEETVGRLRAESVYWPVQAGQIRRAYARTEGDGEPATDPVYSIENHRAAAIAYIRGESSVMAWPAAWKADSSGGEDDGFEFLNGEAHYASAYAEVEAALSEDDGDCTDLSVRNGGSAA